MPILGIMASQISGHLWAPEGAYDSLATVTLSTSTASIDFAGIPSGYKHLQIRSISYGGYATLRFNGDTTASNYNYHYLEGDGASAVSGYGANNAYYPTLNSATANTFVAGVLDLLDYNNTNKYKTGRILNGIDKNGSGAIDFDSILWRNTNAITSITLTAVSTNFAQYSSFALYGVK